MTLLQIDCRNSPTNSEKWPKKQKKNGPKCENKGSKTLIYPKKKLKTFKIILLHIYCRNSPKTPPKIGQKAEKKAKKAK